MGPARDHILSSFLLSRGFPHFLKNRITIMSLMSFPSHALESSRSENVEKNTFQKSTSTSGTIRRHVRTEKMIPSPLALSLSLQWCVCLSVFPHTLHLSPSPPFYSRGGHFSLLSRSPQLSFPHELCLDTPHAWGPLTRVSQLGGQSLKD